MLKNTLEVLAMWYWKNMQKISWTERRTNEDVLKTIKEIRTLIDSPKKKMANDRYTLYYAEMMKN